MSRPRVSVIVPVYNRARAVQAAAASVLDQSYQDFELILVDDGSTDDSGRVIDELARQQPERIRCSHQENAGVAAARNQGISLSRGEYICFLDSDDEWLPEKLAVQVDFMDRHKEIGLSYVWALVVDEAGKVVGREGRRAGRNAYRKLFYLNPIAPTSGTMLRREVLEEVGLFDPDLRTRQDWDLWFRIARRYPVREIPQFLVRYQSSESGISADLGQTANDNRTVLERALRRDEETGGPMHRQEKRVLAFLSLRLAYKYLQAGERASFRRHFREVIRLCPMVLAQHPRVSTKCLLAAISTRR
ncbi:MAG: glycosyltransferase family 2 protein [Armatimonadota bacterium]|nr:MAG: glycosyltransferase family 2 protein [Armatimonadota bacterium]